MSLLKEIFEQPQVMHRLVTEQWDHTVDIAQQLQRRGFRYVFLAARGTSDNAGRYAQYVWGTFNRIPMALAAPSLFSLYQQPPLLDGALVIAVSQSGRSTDIRSVVTTARQQGVPTLAITNDTNSPLAQEAEVVIDVMAGEEKAVAATKSYTAQLMALAMFSVALQECGRSAEGVPSKEERRSALEKVAEWQEECLKLNDQIADATQRYRYMEHCVVLGRGYNYASAYEWSLKLKELSYVGAEPYSSADFLHGPVAIVERGYPVLAVAPSGMVFSSLWELLRHLKEDQHAELLVISDRLQALELADVPIRLPAEIPEWVSPLVAIVPAQLFSYHLTHIKGFDAEAPRGLKKVTISV